MKNHSTHLSCIPKVLSLVMFVAILSLLSTGAKAQCPDPHMTPPASDTDVAWTGPFSRNEAVRGCNVIVTYCSRRLHDGTIQVIATGVYVPPGSPCDTIPINILIAGAANKLIEDVSVIFVPPCDGHLYYGATLLTSRCWFEACVDCPAGGPYAGFTSLLGCGAAYCVKTCQICHSVVGGHDVNETFGCMTSIIGEGNCVPLSETTMIQLGVCYDVSSCQF